ncbi:MAG: YfhO family protein [Lachnospiraceae bacterium]|nr:YfhO family protein [Lachnospiraceae bacterium]
MKQRAKRLNRKDWAKWEERLPLMMAFFIPLFIGIVVCIDHGVYPFGDRSILKVDMYHQYAPFFSELREKLQGGESLMYSFDIGLGADFISLYAYYLASPLNWLLLLCPAKYILEFMLILTLLKLALSGLTFGYYLKCHYKINDLALSVFAASYALSGYVAAYSWNIMWTDCIVLFPLIILGVERLVKEGDGRLYYVALAVSIISNYYISIMICIFLVLYFGIIWLEQDGGKIKALFNFAWYSLLAGGTGAILIIPEAIILGGSGSGTIKFPETMEWYYNLIAQASRHLLMAESNTTQVPHWPNLYCGVFVLLLLVLYVLNGGIPWQQKVKRLILAALLYVSFANNILEFIWHGLDAPDSLPGRQAFLYIFLLIVLSYEAYIYIQETKFWQVLVALAADCVLLFAAFKTYSGTDLAEKHEFVAEAESGFSFLGVGFNQFDITAIFLLCYGLMFVLFVVGKKSTRQLMGTFILLFILTELTVHFDTEGLGTTSRTSYMADYEDYKNVLEIAKEREKASSDTGAVFYRVEQMERRTKNDSAFYNFPSATQFSSLMNIDVSHIYQYIGMEGGKNFYCYNGATPLFSAMLSMKYQIADSALEESPFRTLVASSGDAYLYENTYSLPLGYIVPETAVTEWEYKGKSDFENINGLAAYMGAQGSFLVPVSTTDEEGVTTLEVLQDGYYYMSRGKIDFDTLTMESSDGRSKSYAKASHSYFLDLGYAKTGDVIRVKNNEKETLSTQGYFVNVNALEEAYDRLNTQTMQLTKNTITEIEGTIDVTEAGYFVLSIAKEPGWTLYVDDVETEAETFGEAFFATYLEEGEHFIRLSYETPGLAMGAVVSGICILAFVATVTLKHQMKKR